MTADHPQNAPQTGKSILIVDDEQDIRDSLESRLQTAGFRVQTASSGQEAVATFIKCFYDGPFDVILLDINLPDMDGIDVLKLVRQEEQLRGIKDMDGVIVVMQAGVKESWMDAFKKGRSEERRVGE